IQIYPGTDGAFTMYDDDGASFAYERGDWMGLAMQWTDRQRRLTLKLADGSRMRAPSPRPLRVRVVGDGAGRDVTFNGQPLEVRL
ncbi:MAG TPA: DUF5110 domain-containing protein, partial [Vicinamibacterales bacterium]|nr:DUF5110 domain-containing protein [Vicinamibacterales bacterium]